MKKITYILKTLGALFVLLVMSACTDELDKVPTDHLSVDRLLGTLDVQEFRDNSYYYLDQTFNGYTGGELMEVYSDDAFKAGRGISRVWHEGLLTPENSLFSMTKWSQYWSGIRNCNLALKYLPQATVSKNIVSQESLNIWYDEVKILRAWYHFLLVKDFGPLPFVDEPFEADYQGWEELERPSYDEILTRIVKEIDEVINNDVLPLRWQAPGDYDKVNMAVAYALKSRIMLYHASPLYTPQVDRDKWQNAVEAAQQAIDSIVPEYQIVTMDDYGTLFSENYEVFNDEIILRSPVNGADIMNRFNGIDLSSLGSPTQAENCGAVPTQELVDCFELKDGSLPVESYNDSEHVNVTFSDGYSEDLGEDPYGNRDSRLYHSIIFNGSNYGKYKGMSASDNDLVIYTYEGKNGTGFNSNPLSQDDSYRRRSCTGYYSKKFRSASYWGGQVGGVNANKIYFRVAEIYLNLAEAHCELGNLNEAADALNIIRVRAGQPDIQSVPGFSNTKDFLRKRIRNERRVELCFENHRFYDQRRWKILQETNGAITGMKVTSNSGTDAGPFSYQRIEVDVPRQATSDKYLMLPVPLQEARRLPGIGQPPVWD